MRLGTSQSARPAAIDRNPVMKAFGYNSISIAPHATTVRYTYTVPAGKKFKVGSINHRMTRDAAAAPAALANAYTEYTPNGGGAVIGLLINVYTNVVGDHESVVGAQGADLNAGDLITAKTADLSTGGTFNYSSGLIGTEYDA